MQMRRLFLFTIVLAAVACRPAAPVTSTIILVRHAERPPGADPDLNAEGQARAESLAVALARTTVDGILTTQFKRTAQTAIPLARAKNITPVVVQAAGPESAHTNAVVRALQAYAGKTAVYIGHSNTVPSVIQGLGLAPVAAIPDSVHSRLYIVRRRGAELELTIVRYGK